MSDLLAKAKRESEDVILWRRAHAAGRAEAMADAALACSQIKRDCWDNGRTREGDGASVCEEAIRALKDKP